MANVFHDFSDWFWNEDFWLPPNVTWADLERKNDVFIAKPSDLWIPFPLAALLFAARLLWER